MQVLTLSGSIFYRTSSAFLRMMVSISSTPYIFGLRKIASIDGKGDGFFPPPNFKRPFMKRTSARFKMKW